MEALEFTGFTSVQSLYASQCSEITTEAGVYGVVRPTEDSPRFLTVSVGGWFKGKDPTVDVELLCERWIADASVLYLGMAGSNLRQRIRALIDYGNGRPVGHQGGRYLWQVDGSAGFLVAWKIDRDPRHLESRLLAEFEKVHARLPFANVSH
jgi:hypothetical protein